MNIKGNILIDFNKAPLLSTEFKEDTVIIDIKDTSVFDFIDLDNIKIDSKSKDNSKSNFWEMIHNARDFAQELKDKGLTVILCIKGKETVIIGEKAKPSISQILSKSKNIQIKSVIETAKLSKEILD